MAKEVRAGRARWFLRLGIVLAVSAGASQWLSASGRYRLIAKRHHSQYVRWRKYGGKVVISYQGPGTLFTMRPEGDPPGPGWQEVGRDDSAKMTEYHARLEEKYRRAMWFPWLAFQSDPPPPRR